MSDERQTPPVGPSPDPAPPRAADDQWPGPGADDTRAIELEQTAAIPASPAQHGGVAPPAAVDWASRPGLAPGSGVGHGEQGPSTPDPSAPHLSAPDPSAQHSSAPDPDAPAHPQAHGGPAIGPLAASGGSTAYGPVPGRPPTHGEGVPWPAVLAMALLVSLGAGLLGGLGGGLLAASQGWRLRGGGSSSIPTAGAGATERPAGSVASIAARALPSVVTVQVQGSGGAGTGSGFVVDRAGHVVTNNHVVASAASGGKIKLQLSNGDEVDATIVGRDTSYDLAVLRTSRTDLVPLTMGRSGEVVVGDPVIAVGAPLGLESTVTTGIVSALNRPVSPGGSSASSASYISAIQTDAAINPGNSGGPLLNDQGQVIGVNSAIAAVPGTSQTSGSIGVGFAIPSDQVRRTADQLIKTGKAEHPVIGVMLDTRYEGAGARISDQGDDGRQPITPGGPAAKAGLRPGDVIIELDGKRVVDPDALIVAIRAKNVGDRVSLTVQRGGSRRDVTMTLGASD